jgi:2-C-methyl-D-erythritol 4-phosphate cytidylyltransferase
MLNNIDHIRWEDDQNNICVYTKNDILQKHILLLQFKKIKNVLYSNNYHIYYDQSYINYNKQDITHLLQNDFERISLNHVNIPTNPKFLFLSLYVNPSFVVKMGVHCNRYKWTLHKGNIITNDKYLNISNNILVISNDKCKWEINNGLIKNVSNNMYISCDIHYNITLCQDKKDAIPFYIKNNSIYYLKPKLRVEYEMVNCKNYINVSDIYKIKHNQGINIGVILAAGTSTRFNYKVPKQLYKINGIPIIMYSINAMINLLNKIIIVTNSTCYDQIYNLIKDNDKVTVLINDENCRLESINVAINHVKKDNIKNIIIHDAARPYITEECISKLLSSCESSLYAQYYMKLVNGLFNKETNKMVNRDDYVEICTPIVANFELFYFIFMNYICKEKRIVYEHIPILTILGIKYDLIEGSYENLKKITYFNDIL